MFGFIKKMFIGLLSFGVPTRFGDWLATKCVSMSNQPYQPRPAIVNINSHEPLYYPFTISINKCVGSCNTIDDSFARIFVPKRVKMFNIKVFNFMP